MLETGLRLSAKAAWGLRVGSAGVALALDWHLGILPAWMEARINEMSEPTTPNQIAAEIDDKVKPYLFWTVMWVSAINVVGIPFIPFIAIIYWAWYAPRYNEFHTLELSATGIETKRGVVFRSQTNVPLDRITDVAVHQGPLMRHFGVYKVTIESAGQTQMQGAANVIGVAEPYAFRDAVLENVEMFKLSVRGDAATADDELAALESNVQTHLLTEIRDILARMEGQRS